MMIRKAAAAVSAHPLVSGTTATGCVVAFLFWKQYSETYSVLVDTQNTLQQEVDKSLEASRKMLRELDAQLAADLKRKDDLLIRLQLQNVEQKRSIDRLVQALKVCQVETSQKV
jgi:hypothetical protein